MVEEAAVPRTGARLARREPSTAAGASVRIGRDMNGDGEPSAEIPC